MGVRDRIRRLAENGGKTSAERSAELREAATKDDTQTNDAETAAERAAEAAKATPATNHSLRAGDPKKAEDMARANMDAVAEAARGGSPRNEDINIRTGGGRRDRDRDDRRRGSGGGGPGEDGSDGGSGGSGPRGGGGGSGGSGGNRDTGGSTGESDGRDGGSAGGPRPTGRGGTGGSGGDRGTGQGTGTGGTGQGGTGSSTDEPDARPGDARGAMPGMVDNPQPRRGQPDQPAEEPTTAPSSEAEPARTDRRERPANKGAADTQPATTTGGSPVLAGSGDAVPGWQEGGSGDGVIGQTERGRFTDRAELERKYLIDLSENEVKTVDGELVLTKEAQADWAARILSRKLENVEITDADVVQTDEGGWTVTTDVQKRLAARELSRTESDKIRGELTAEDITQTEDGFTVELSALAPEYVAEEFGEQLASQIPGEAYDPNIEAEDVRFNSTTNEWELTESGEFDVRRAARRAGAADVAANLEQRFGVDVAAGDVELRQQPTGGVQLSGSTDVQPTLGGAGGATGTTTTATVSEDVSQAIDETTATAAETTVETGTQPTRAAEIPMRTDIVSASAATAGRQGIPGTNPRGGVTNTVEFVGSNAATVGETGIVGDPRDRIDPQDLEEVVSPATSVVGAEGIPATRQSGPSQADLRELDERIDEQAGTDLERGVDYTITRSGRQTRAVLTEEGRRKIRASRAKEAPGDVVAEVESAVGGAVDETLRTVGFESGESVFGYDVGMGERFSFPGSGPVIPESVMREVDFGGEDGEEFGDFTLFRIKELNNKRFETVLEEGAADLTAGVGNFARDTAAFAQRRIEYGFGPDAGPNYKEFRNEPVPQNAQAAGEGAAAPITFAPSLVFKEVPEFVGYAATEGAADLGAFGNRLAGEAIERGYLAGRGLQQNPIGFGAMIAGSLVSTGAVMRFGPRGTRYLIQPGEEAAIALGRRVPAFGRAVTALPGTGIRPGHVEGGARPRTAADAGPGRSVRGVAAAARKRAPVRLVEDPDAPRVRFTGFETPDPVASARAAGTGLRFRLANYRAGVENLARRFPTSLSDAEFEARLAVGRGRKAIGRRTPSRSDLAADIERARVRLDQEVERRRLQLATRRAQFEDLVERTPTSASDVAFDIRLALGSRSRPSLRPSLGNVPTRLRPRVDENAVRFPSNLGQLGFEAELTRQRIGRLGAGVRAGFSGRLPSLRVDQNAVRMPTNLGQLGFEARLTRLRAGQLRPNVAGSLPTPGTGDGFGVPSMLDTVEDIRTRVGDLTVEIGTPEVETDTEGGGTRLPFRITAEELESEGGLSLAGVDDTELETETEAGDGPFETVEAGVADVDIDAGDVGRAGARARGRTGTGTDLMLRRETLQPRGPRADLGSGRSIGRSLPRVEPELTDAAGETSRLGGALEEARARADVEPRLAPQTASRVDTVAASRVEVLADQRLDLRQRFDARLDPRTEASDRIDTRLEPGLDIRFEQQVETRTRQEQEAKVEERTEFPTEPPRNEFYIPDDGGSPSSADDRGRQPATAPDAGENLLAPGWASETLTDFALGVDVEPRAGPSQEELAARPREERIIGELPTTAMLSGGEEAQKAIEDARRVFFGGGN